MCSRDGYSDEPIRRVVCAPERSSHSLTLLDRRGRMLLVEDDEIKTEVTKYFGRMNGRRLDDGSNKQVPVCICIQVCPLRNQELQQLIVPIGVRTPGRFTRWRLLHLMRRFATP